MNKFICLFIFLPAFLFGQQNNNVPAPQREVKFNSNGNVTITWSFPDYNSYQIEENQTIFDRYIIPGFGFLHETGRPDLPAYIDQIGIPINDEARVSIHNIEYYPAKNKYIIPSQPPRQDNYQAEVPPFTMDTAFYQQDLNYPASHVTLDNSQDLKNIRVSAVQICPFQYNPAQRKLRAVKKISYTISYTGGPQATVSSAAYSSQFKKIIKSRFLNGTQISAAIQQNAKTSGSDPDYLIVTTQQFLPAAEKLAQWKSQMGFRTEIISRSQWNSGQVKNAIHSRYANYSPKPDYFVIIGDHNDVPGEILTGSNGSFASDHYYACMGGPSDYTADIAKGRISASGLVEAHTIVDKIITYEKRPTTDSSFYNTGLNCAYFQHAGGGYAERRFAQTSEDLRNYAVSIGYNVNRVYYAHSNVNPTYWNNTYYSAGEPLPSYLTKPTFAWDGDKYDIINHVNTGAFFVFHRDHGYTQGWGDPAFNSGDVNSFSNGDKMPIFFSINCLTGKFVESECFTEKLLRKSNGGAVGVFGHAEVSYSGYNDALSLGLFDGIWSNPGLIPNFTGSGGISNPSLPSHGDIRRGGDLVNHGIARMTATWGANQYTNELFHYFGDPAMDIRVDFPEQIIAANTDTLNCTSDSAIVINNINTDSVHATLVVDGELLGKSLLTGTQDTLFFTHLSGNQAFLTLYKTGYAPYVDTISIQGGCPKAKIVMGPSMLCTGDSITFSENSFGNIANYSWSFGNSSSMATAGTAGPHTIIFATGGKKTVYLTVSTAGSLSHTDSVSFTIDPICKYSIPGNGNMNIDKCNGKLYDDGGDMANYSNNTDGSVTIAPSGASTISLTFSQFHYEAGYDQLKVYDGPTTNAPLIGSYDGNALPNGGVINSTSNAITIQQESDPMVTELGFELEWQCVYPNTPPTAYFKASDTASCTGMIDFRDQSLFGPVSWEWNFGDGNTSTQQNPSHQYMANGTYNVSLKVTNSYGADSLIKSSYVVVNMPGTPSAQSGIRCKAGSVKLSATPPASGNGYLRWFNSPNSTNELDTGAIFISPILGSSKSYYVDYANEKPPVYGAKADYTGGGSYFTAAYDHHLVFDVHEAITLVSVKVYAGSSGNRTIELRDDNGHVQATKTVNIPAGESRITLNFSIAAGTDYELSGPASPDLYRNNAGLSYPYYISDLATIKGSSASSDPTGYYYYFYDWEVQGPPCHSPRVKVDAIISDTLNPITDFNFSMSNDPDIQFTDQSTYATSHLWSFGDGNISSLPNPNHSYAANGIYDVQLKAFNGCGSDSITQQVQINAAAINEYSENTLDVYPNPTTAFITITLPQEISNTAVLQVVDHAGRHIQSEVFNANGRENYRYNLEKLAAGSYFILIHTDSKTYISKIIKE